MNRTGISGQVAFVTGAGQGIGAAVARAFAELGADVAAVDRDGEKATETAEKLAAEGHRARAYRADVADPAAVAEVVTRVEAEQGPIDVLANVAGVLQVGTVQEITDAEWQRTFAVNTTGVFTVCREVSGHMISRRRGCIVTVGSNAAGVPRHSMAAYAASKAAATMFTKSLGLELAEHGIRCNIVAPGSTDTEMQRGMWTDGSGPERVIAGSPETYKAGIPLRKLATPEDIAHAVVFLAPDEAGHITMHDLYVDGGATLRA
ncbi:2,3-dihydro-2,3-dihydroxybenzoate dehydrogenase [Saccharopolyspora rhizosphaerae]|uniref:2,3-dihydro-2,3-dihydroxybenzoate dehydrogenase n=1 Tax=Saccharopolyspora rhizosphaerae TaxID=2492662 RepID=A0A426K0K6_9PSEU|nr:2,3-dihydro-2,3-dihydroxybenzoate dehydrogenase [Saccharopolyspora rhizosphaerae]RRO18975.1 2,3-dihydro-2,3-dihydroxybenzoate dehydrogenase [Saccharopolyspora rhizosphaerae]